MSNIISEVVKIKFNSFNLAPALLSYFENCQVKQDNVLLLYLLFPVVLNSDWIDGSPRAQKRSRLETWVKENRIHIEGLPERISTFQRLSETTLQYCIDMEYARLDEKNNRVIVVEGFVYAPDKMKRTMLRRLEAALYTLETPSDGDNTKEDNGKN